MIRKQEETISGSEATYLAGTFRMLGDPSRVRIISTMFGGEMCVRDVIRAVGMSQSAVSHQLAILRECGLVECRKVGREVYYSLKNEYIVRFLDTARAMALTSENLLTRHFEEQDGEKSHAWNRSDGRESLPAAAARNDLCLSADSSDT